MRARSLRRISRDEPCLALLMISPVFILELCGCQELLQGSLLVIESEE